MYPDQGFSSGPYTEMFTVNPLLPHNNNYSTESVGGEQIGAKFITSMDGVDTMTMQPCQGLSLSLGTQLPSSTTASVPPFQYQYHDTGFLSLMNSFLPNLNRTSISKDNECMTSITSGGFHDITKRGEEAFFNQHSSIYPSDPCMMKGSPGLSNTVLNSHYLKAAQELLDEIVNVRKAMKQTGIEKQEKCRDIGLDNSKDTTDGKPASQSMQISSGHNGSNSNPSCELSPLERQNLLDKKTKLLSMLDEVDKRYRQYCHQMQIVVSSLDMVAGCGAAEPYTTVALRTISRHFRALRDAISGQIQVTQRSLGEQEGIPRLRYVDQHLRQQKALQQLGVMRQAWRPQRGLPESSVSILRAWLFEHFLHPYPKDSEKVMLARQTGLTRNQVANWFINARVRLWKPMIEDIYKEEFSDNSEKNCNILSENTVVKGKRDHGVEEVDNNNNNLEEPRDNNLMISGDSFQHGQLHGLEEEHERGDHGENVMGCGTRKLQKLSSSVNNGFYSSGDGTQMASTSSMPPAATCDLSDELGNFTTVTVGGHVSLALELRNCESDGLTMSSDDAIHKRRSGNNNNNNNNNQTLLSSSETTEFLDYHFTDSGKQQHRFGNTHLLHEFVV